MPQEIEQKFTLRDADALRSRLRAIAARRESLVLEQNTLFDDRAASLRGRGCGLRLRSATDERNVARHHLTFKGPLASTGALRSREELETDVADPAVLVAILHRLGYSPRVRYEKRRETWTLPADSALVLIDELPRLGMFVEVEAPSASDVKRVAGLLNLPDTDAEERTYVALAAECGTADAAGVIVLAF
ncbi:MAG: class IV adenylate cyclase [Phycisphaerales bacterium]|nr:class IV adenylate cyclase [Phycisphaerales bacterium]